MRGSQNNCSRRHLMTDNICLGYSPFWYPVKSYFAKTLLLLKPGHCELILVCKVSGNPSSNRNNDFFVGWAISRCLSTTPWFVTSTTISSKDEAKWLSSPSNRFKGANHHNCPCFLTKMGQSRPLFVYFCPFHITISIIQIERSIDCVLGITTCGRWMVGTDETTELWRPPNCPMFDPNVFLPN